MNRKRRYAKEEFARRGDGELLIRD